MVLSAYPGPDLSTVPAGSAPEGQTSNLIDPPSVAYRVTICNIVCLVIVLTAVVLRMYTRIRLVKYVGYDDYCSLLALVFWISTAAVFQYSTKSGVGKHIWNVSLSDTYPQIIRLWSVGAAMYGATMLLTKLSILLLYRRLFPINNFLLRWHAVLLFTIGYSVAGVFTSIFQCWPIRSAWELRENKPQHCIQVRSFYLSLSAMNIFSDLLILGLPIPIVWGLNLRLRQKIVLSVLFLLGSLSCVASVFRLVFVNKSLTTYADDLPWGLVQVILVSQCELTAAMICACAPCLRPFFERYTPFLFLSQDSGYHNSNTGPYVNTVGGSSRPKMRTRALKADDDDQIELNPGSRKTGTEISVAGGPDSDAESSNGTMHRVGERSGIGHDAIVVRTTYNVKRIHEV